MSDRAGTGESPLALRARRPPRTAPPLRRRGAAAQRRFARHVVVPGYGNHVLRRHVLRLSGLPTRLFSGLRRRQPKLELDSRDIEHCRSDLQQLDCRFGGPRLATWESASSWLTCCWPPSSSAYVFLPSRATSGMMNTFITTCRPSTSTPTTWFAKTRTSTWIRNTPRFSSRCISRSPGVHALHMIVGIGIFSVITFMAWRGKFSPEYHTPVEIAGLYWHFVDIVWIYLFPLLYLIDRRPGA